MINVEKAIQEEIDNYLAINGEIGAWGEPMRDEIGVDVICNALEEGFQIKTTNIIRNKVREMLLRKPAKCTCGLEEDTRYNHSNSCPLHEELKQFHVTSTINIMAKNRKDAEKRLRYSPENYMDALIRNAEIDASPE